MDKQEFLDEIKEKGVDFIEKKIEDLDENNKYDKRILDKINRFLKCYKDNEEIDEDDDKKKEINENKKSMKKINKRIQLILYNNKDDIKPTKLKK